MKVLVCVFTDNEFYFQQWWSCSPRIRFWQKNIHFAKYAQMK